MSDPFFLVAFGSGTEDNRFPDVFMTGQFRDNKPENMLFQSKHDWADKKS